MNHTKTVKTGNPIVDEIATLNISGNVIPEDWYHTITNENGKVNCLAIHILADIVYWYRPTEHRDESTLSVTYIKKIHDNDYLQGAHKNVDTPLQNCKKGATKTGVPTCENIGTYTNTTTENTANTTTSTSELAIPASVVNEAKINLSDLGLSEKDIITIVRASGNDLSKCKTAKRILDQQTQKIQNVVGWMIKDVMENYQSVSKKPATRKNPFHDYQQRNYDFEELEKYLLAN